MTAVLVLLGICGVVLVMVSTWRYGPGTFLDSAGYFSTARSLVAGKGFFCPGGGRLAQGPPLFPGLLVFLDLLGVGLPAGIRWLNALTFGLTVFFSGVLFLRGTTSRLFALAGTVSVLASAPLLEASVAVGPAPLFILLSLLFLLCMATFLGRRDRPSLVLSAVFAGLAGLLAYAGSMVILAGLLLIAFGTVGIPVFRRARYVAVFAGLSAPGATVWFLCSCFLRTPSAPAHDWPALASRGPWQSLASSAGAMAGWLFPETDSNWATLGVVGLIVAVSAVAVVASVRRRGRAGGRMRLIQIVSVVVVGLLVLGFLLVFGVSPFEDAGRRAVGPLYVLVMLLVVAGIEDGSAILSARSDSPGLVRSLGLAVYILWLLYPLSVTAESVETYVRQGAGGAGAFGWRESPLLQWLRRSPPDGAVYSNVPDVIGLLAGVSAESTPCHRDPDGFARLQCSSASRTVVWSHLVRRDRLYDLQEVVSRYTTTPIATFPDGVVCRLEAEGGPGVSAVYRFWSPGTGRHYYTMSKSERDELIGEPAPAWTYEGSAFHVFADPVPGTLAVHAFRAAERGVRFFTIDEAEKNLLIRNHSDTWSYEGVAFHAYSEPNGDNAIPVYRLWSKRSHSHFYTIDPDEKDRLLADYPETWIAEGIAWYAYGR